MKLPIGWLNDYVSTEELTPEELADKLLSVGFEVEEIIRLGADIAKYSTSKNISTPINCKSAWWMWGARSPPS